VPVEAVFGGGGVERLAIVELHPGAQSDGDGLAVGRRLVTSRELRHDVGLLVDVEELVAQRGKDDAGGVKARQARIEAVGIVTQADAQVALAEGAAGGQAEGGGHGRATGSLSHDRGLPCGRPTEEHALCQGARAVRLGVTRSAGSPP
jgi:hypothetical protein